MLHAVTSRLIARARMATARTAEIIARSRALKYRTASLRQKIEAGRAERSTAAMRRGWVSEIAPLPLSPAMLREISAEFRALADQANSPESRIAYHDLAFRYMAMAAGYDTGAMHSRMFH